MKYMPYIKPGTLDSIPVLIQSLAMKNSLLIVLVLSVLGFNHVSSQSTSSNFLGPLILGGLAGWGLNSIVQRNRRQEAINNAMLAQTFGPVNPRFGGFPGGFGRPRFGHPPTLGHGGAGFCKYTSSIPP
jgi:hypothetical protein